MGMKVFTLAIAGTAIGFLTASHMIGPSNADAAAVETVAMAQLDLRSDRLPLPMNRAAVAPIDVSQDGVRRTAEGIRIVGPVFLPED